MQEKEKMSEQRRIVGVLGILLLGCAAAVILSICVGAVMYSPLSLWRADAGSAAGRILRYSRMPRTCCSLLAGAALAVAGAVIQKVLVNPLAGPNIIGVNSGAGFIVAVSMAFLPYSVWTVSAAAFLGAMLGMLIVLGISHYTEASKTTLVLAGVAITSMFSGATDGVVTFVPDALRGYTDFRIGGFRGVTMERLLPAFLIIMIGFALLLFFHHEMDILSLGEETARSLGLKVGPVRIILLAGAALLAGGAVSFSGILGFVGLIVPHMVRKVLGSDSLPLLIGSALAGATLVTICDTLARSLFSPYELPVGILLSMLGAPFFLWLLFGQKRGKK